MAVGVEEAREDGVVRAAGGIVLRDGRLLLVHRPKYDDWTFPKGKCEPGESDEACALREVEEETGLRVRARRRAAVDRSTPIRAGGRSGVRWWRDGGRGRRVHADHEVDEIRWLTRERGRRAPLVRARPRFCSTLPRLAAARRLASRSAAPSRIPPRDGVERLPEQPLRPPRGSVRRRGACAARVGRTPSASADSAAGLLREDVDEPRARPARLVADTPARARALPPVASATSGCGGASSASPARTACSRGGDLSAVGRIARKQSRGQPQRAEVDGAHPRRPGGSVPTTTSVEPPPTSQTATTPSAGDSPARRAAEREPALLLGGDAPGRRRRSPASSASTRPPAIRAWRPGAVTTISSSPDAELAGDPRRIRAAPADSSSFRRRTRP